MLKAGLFASLLALTISQAAAVLALAEQDQYFPREFTQSGSGCNGRPLISTIEERWYPSHWIAAKEPPIYALSRQTKAAASTTYRFTWLRTFHAPVIVRLEASGNDMRMIAKELSGKGGYEPGVVVRQLDRRLTESERTKVLALLNESQVFDLAADVCSAIRGLDGAQWILESAEPGKYRYVNRQSPERGPLHAVGLEFIALTGWRYDDVY